MVELLLGRGGRNNLEDCVKLILSHYRVDLDCRSVAEGQPELAKLLEEERLRGRGATENA